jgi:(E)-4-hydroxy-3-methylbut-2-enyl-diphosphate synthase
MIETPQKGADPVALSFNILQAAQVRISKTEFISCPSCGRTLFDLQEVTARIKSRTGHLVGVKIAIMGCIVNGPGEMADADFGYVGGAPGLINLYVGKDCVEKGIPFDVADGRLVELIKKNGMWKEPGAVLK